MVLQATGQIRFSEIISEFRRSQTQTGISTFYQGAGIVNFASQKVPKAGQIKSSDYYGAVYAVEYSLSFISNGSWTNVNVYNNLTTTPLGGITRTPSNTWDGVTPVAVTLNISGDQNTRAQLSGFPALNTGTGYPSGSAMYLINRGWIGGNGGNGGPGGTSSSRNGGNGQNGGDGLNMSINTILENYYIISGGGGGGGGGSAETVSYLQTNSGCPGGGGLSRFGDPNVFVPFCNQSGGKGATGGAIGKNGNNGESVGSNVGGTGGAAGFAIRTTNSATLSGFTGQVYGSVQ